MRVRRLVILAGCAGAALWTAPAAFGCELTGLSVEGPSGTTVHAGDPITYTIYARTTADSPDDSPYQINIDSHAGLARGYAAPNANGGEWSETSTFTMPDLGTGTMDVTVSATTATQYLAAPVRLHYVGAPAASGAPTTPPTLAAQPDTAGTPARPGAPATTGRPLAQPKGQQPRHRAAAQHRRAHRPARPQPTLRPVYAPVAVDRVVAAAQPVAAAPPAEHAARRLAHSVNRAAVAPRVDDVPAAVPARADIARDARARSLPPTAIIALALLALAAAGGGTYALARRRAPRPIDPDGTIEAELQEILAEERAASREAARTRAPP